MKAVRHANLVHRHPQRERVISRDPVRQVGAPSHALLRKLSDAYPDEVYDNAKPSVRERVLVLIVAAAGAWYLVGLIGGAAASLLGATG